jgi:hypothetical protein
MHKTEVEWGVVRAKLNDVLAQYKGSPTTLSRDTGVDFYAIRRFLNKGVKSRGSNAFELCAYFGIETTRNAQTEGPELHDLHKLLDEVWDGTHSHAALLAKLIESTRDYIVEERRGPG